MSLAATTTTALTLIDAPSLKINATTSDTTTCPLPAPPIATAWTPDNATLYIASSHAIQAFADGNLSPVYTAPPDAPLAPLLAARDASTVVFAQDKTVHLLATASRPPKITSSLPAHATPVVALALSSDATLLASASAAGVLHVYNLAHNANTVLRGFPGTSRAPCVCAFDPHVRTRLYVGAGTTLAIYDTSRTGGPVKTVALAEKSAAAGNILAISSSPYSKTLVAVACSALVGLVDLDKEKPLFRAIPVKVPVTSMTFTGDGSAVAMGTESGRVLVQNLRTMERVPRVFDVGNGARVVALSTQKRVKGAPSASLTVPRITASQSAPLAARDLNTAARRAVSARTPATPKTRGRAFSPPRAPVPRGNEGEVSVELETLIGGGAAKKQGQGAGARRPSSRLAAAASRKASLAPSDVSTRGREPAPSTRTATPDLPPIAAAESPLWAGARAPPQAQDGALTTPDVERWVDAGRGPRGGGGGGGGGGAERRVGWVDGGGADADAAASGSGERDAAVSPPTGTSTPPAPAPAPSMDMSPIRRPHAPAQDLLRAVVQDVMYEYRQETREGLRGLHLDLLKLGRSWKGELRTMMDEYVGDLRELRAENARLRSENERLRRGY